MTENMPVQWMTFGELLELFRSKWKWLTIGLVVGALLLFLYTTLFVPDRYTTSISFYVQNTEDTGDVATSNNLSASRLLANTYVMVLQTTDALELAQQNMTSPVTVGQLHQALSVTASRESPILTVSATAQDPLVAQNICEAMTLVAPELLYDKVGTGTVKAIGEVPSAIRSGPRAVRNAMLGAVIGVLVTAAVVIIIYRADTTIKDRKDLQQETDLPLLGEIPSLSL